MPVPGRFTPQSSLFGWEFLWDSAAQRARGHPAGNRRSVASSLHLDSPYARYKIVSVPPDAWSTRRTRTERCRSPPVFSTIQLSDWLIRCDDAHHPNQDCRSPTGFLAWHLSGAPVGHGLPVWGGGATHAGLTSSQVVVVVNGDSFNSRTLANHFVALRRIPARNVIVLTDVPSSEVITVEVFRQQILRPLLNEIDRRRLAGQVDCIAYSADFPTCIDIAEDLKPLGDIHKVFTTKGSINGLTYLYAQVARKIPSYISAGGECLCASPDRGLFRQSWRREHVGEMAIHPRALGDPPSRRGLEGTGRVPRRAAASVSGCLSGCFAGGHGWGDRPRYRAAGNGD